MIAAWVSLLGTLSWPVVLILVIGVCVVVVVIGCVPEADERLVRVLAAWRGKRHRRDGKRARGLGR